jgi:hypothetical protein
MISKISLLGLLMIISLFSCKKTIDPGEVSREMREVPAFHAVEFGHGFHAEVRYSEDVQEVIIEAPENFQPYIYTSVHNGTLRIQVDNGIRLNNMKHRRLFITTPNLSGIDASGGSRISGIDEFNSTRFSLLLSGGSQGDFSINCDQLQTQLSGGSILHLYGHTQALHHANISGGSQLYAFPLETRNTSIIVSGGSKVEIDVTEQLSVTASGGSTIHYSGSPTILHKETTGGSSIIKMN